MHKFVISNIENILNISEYDHFKMSKSLKESIFRALIKIVNNIGIKKFKPFL